MSGFPKVGDHFGGYEITGVIGHGGMGVVFSARQQGLNRPVALKVLDPRFADDPEFAARFSREAETLAAMDSPHVIQVFDHGTFEGCLYLVTQWVAGGDLAAHLSGHGPLPPAVAIDLTAQIASALADAHARGVIHRDVKPSNVLLARSGQDLFAYLCDFGIAQGQQPGLTQTGLLAGSLAFTAPERHEGRPATERSDLYSLGCLLWVALTGSNPYQGTEFQIANQHVAGPIPRLQEKGALEHGLNSVLARLMAKEPRDRPGSALEVVAELRQLERLAQSAPPMAASGTTGSPVDFDITRVRSQAKLPMTSGYLPSTTVAATSPAGVVPPRGDFSAAVGDTVLSGAATIHRSELTPTEPVPPPGVPPARAALGRKRLLIVMGAVVLALGGAGLGWSVLRPSTSDAAGAGTGESVRVTATAVSTVSGAASHSEQPSAPPARIEPRSAAFSRGRKIGTQGSHAHAVAVDADSRRAYVTNYDSGTVAVIDLKSHRVIRRLLGSSSGCVQPESVAVSRSTQQLLVTCGGSKRVFVFDLSSLDAPRRIKTGTGPLRVAVNEAAKKAYVAARGGSALTVIDLSNPSSASSSIAVGSKPQAIAVDEERQIAYVSRWDSNKVSVVDLRDERTIGHVTVGRNPNGLAVAPEAGLLIVPNYGASGKPAPTTYSVDFISLDTHRKMGTTRLDRCLRPGRVAVDEPAGVAYLTCQNSNKVEVIDLSTLDTIGGGVTVPPRPSGIAVDATTGNVLVTSFDKNVVQILHS